MPKAPEILFWFFADYHCVRLYKNNVMKAASCSEESASTLLFQFHFSSYQE